MGPDAESPATPAAPGGGPRFLLLVVDDLMASSRLETTARHLNYEVRLARSVDAFWAGVQDGPALILLGTHATALPWEDLLRELRTSANAPPVLAFGPHVDAETRGRARDAGATRWVANSRIATDLPDLMTALAAQSPQVPSSSP